MSKTTAFKIVLGDAPHEFDMKACLKDRGVGIHGGGTYVPINWGPDDSGECPIIHGPAAGGGFKNFVESNNEEALKVAVVDKSTGRLKTRNISDSICRIVDEKLNYILSSENDKIPIMVFKTKHDEEIDRINMIHSTKINNWNKEVSYMRQVFMALILCLLSYASFGLGVYGSIWSFMNMWNGFYTLEINFVAFISIVQLALGIGMIYMARGGYHYMKERIDE